jgi:hypothetical protein
MCDPQIKNYKKNPQTSPLQRRNRLPRNLLTHAQRLDPRLLHLFQRANAPDMRIRRVSGAELPGAHGGPATLGVVSWARVAARASGEDGGFAGFERGRRHEEDELEARGGGNSGCHFRGV